MYIVKMPWTTQWSWECIRDTGNKSIIWFVNNVFFHIPLLAARTAEFSYKHHEFYENVGNKYPLSDLWSTSYSYLHFLFLWLKEYILLKIDFYTIIRIIRLWFSSPYSPRFSQVLYLLQPISFLPLYLTWSSFHAALISFACSLHLVFWVWHGNCIFFSSFTLTSMSFCRFGKFSIYLHFLFSSLLLSSLILVPGLSDPMKFQFLLAISKVNLYFSLLLE